MRWATLNGWWYGRLTTPVPSRIVWVTCAGRGEEHLGRGDRLPARRVVLAAPELVVAEPVEVGGEVEVALEHQRRVLAGGMVRSEERAEAQPSIGRP